MKENLDKISVVGRRECVGADDVVRSDKEVVVGQGNG
jgi:hypothetical protein